MIDSLLVLLLLLPVGNDSPPGSDTAEVQEQLRARLEALDGRRTALKGLGAALNQGEDVSLYQILQLTVTDSEDLPSPETLSREKGRLEALLEIEDSLRSTDTPPPPRPPDTDESTSAAEPTKPDRIAQIALPTTLLVEQDDLPAADLLFETGRFAEALSIYKTAGTTDSRQDAKRLYRLALCHERLQQIEEAIKSFEAVAKKFPETILGPQASFNARFLTWRRDNNQASDR